jgi:hypothetical protein
MAVMASSTVPSRPNDSMTSTLAKSEGGSGPPDMIVRSPVEAKLQSIHSTNPPDLVRTDSGVGPRRRSLSPEKQSVQSIHRQQPLPQVATFSPPAGQFVINTLLQVAGFVAAIAFGIYAVKSVTVGNTANQYAGQAVLQAATANQLAILAVCLSNGNQVGHGKCSFRFRAEFTKTLLYTPDARHCVHLLSYRQWCSVSAARCSFYTIPRSSYST